MSELMIMEKSKKQIQSEITREKIIKASTSLLINRSYFGTTISAIAKEVGLTKGALYHHFNSKDDLVLAIIRNLRQIWFSNIGKKVLRANNSIERLQTLLSAHTQLLKKDPTMCLILNNLLSDIETLNPKFLIEIKGIYGEMLSFIQKIIERGQANNELHKDLDAKNTAFTIVGLLRWISCSPLFKLLDFNQEDLTETTEKILLRSLKI